MFGQWRVHRRRAQKACAQCREHKAKCTGSHPCQRCIKRQTTCKFENDHVKAFADKRRPRRLESRPATVADQQLKPPQDPINSESSHGSDNHESPNVHNTGPITASNVDRLHPFQDEPDQGVSQSTPIVQSRHGSAPPSLEVPLTNPLAQECSNYFPDTSGRPVHLGTSSNWSFGRRVLVMTYEQVKQSPLPPENLHFDAASYDLGWDAQERTSSQVDSTSTILPSADYARHLVNSFKFHCGQLYHLFDEEEFMQQFDSYHQDNRNQRGLWFVHYLLILAFGKIFVVQKSKDRKPAGAEFFVLAMKLLPDFHFVVGNYIELIQVMCCAALYLHCIDFRGAAYRMIGQALRVALEDGMHTEMHSQDVDTVYAQKCRRVFWTIYILDRQMSSLMGVPMAISDESIHAAIAYFPEDHQKSEAMAIQIKLSQVLGQISGGVYGEEGRLDKRFLSTTKDMLKKIANVTYELHNSFPIEKSGSMHGVSRLSASLHLLHHQCIVLTTRPLLYSFFRSKIGLFHESSVPIIWSRSIRTLLLMCIESSQQILDILSMLQEQSLLESFLRSDLDATFTSTITLLMAPILNSSLLKDPTIWPSRGYVVLDEMISRGNVLAVQVKAELQQLETILRCLSPGVGSQTRECQQSLRHDILTHPHQMSDLPIAISPPPSTADTGTSTVLENTLQPDDFWWQGNFTTEQLIAFADSIDDNSLDFF